MISTFKLKFGRVLGVTAETVQATAVTVFVGPNNSGKSKILSEIAQYCSTGQKQSSQVILEEAEFSGLAEEQALAAIDHIRQPPNTNEALQVNHIIVGGRNGRVQIQREQLKNAVINPASNVPGFCQWFLKFTTLILDGKSRINLVQQQAAGDLLAAPQSSFQLLFRDDNKRKEVRRIVRDAFGMYFVIDPTNLGQLRIRLSKNAPETDVQERGIHDAAVQFHKKAQLIDEASDGVKAFTGIVTEVMAGDPKVILIDEPEAFLHPSLAALLGKEVSRAALSANKRVFVSTHSPSFVMGCIQSGAPVNIIRLTYRDSIATARLLRSDDILTLMRNPLLRSTGVLSGLFYEFVVVTESDADRAFYQEINERLLRYKPEWGIPNCLFINAQNKQTIRTIIKPLRELGIPAAGVVDVDVLKDGGATWVQLLASGFVPEISRAPLGQIRNALKTAMDATGKDMKRDGGISILDKENKEAAENLFSQLAEYGIFVVPGGELESWLLTLRASGHGPSWLIEVFEKMGEDPEAAGYLTPSTDDVWAFMGNVKSWLVSASRKGIPE